MIFFPKLKVLSERDGLRPKRATRGLPCRGRDRICSFVKKIKMLGEKREPMEMETSLSCRSAK